MRVVSDEGAVDEGVGGTGIEADWLGFCIQLAYAGLHGGVGGDGVGAECGGGGVMCLVDMPFEVASRKKGLIACLAWIGALAKCPIRIAVFVAMAFAVILIFAAMLVCIVCRRVRIDVVFGVSVVGWLGGSARFMRTVSLLPGSLLGESGSKWLLWRLLRRCLAIGIRAGSA